MHRANDIGLDVIGRVVVGRLGEGCGNEVKHDVNAVQRGIDVLGVGEVTRHKLGSRSPGRVLRHGRIGAVEHPDAMTLGGYRITEMRAQEAPTSQDQAMERILVLSHGGATKLCGRLPGSYAGLGH